MLFVKAMVFIIWYMGWPFIEYIHMNISILNGNFIDPIPALIGPNYYSFITPRA